MRIADTLLGKQPQYQILAKEIEFLCEEGQRLGAYEGVKRIQLVCDQYNQLTPHTAHLWIDLPATQNEIEEAQNHTRKMGIVHFIRNASSLLPLVLTWSALFDAVGAYQNYLASPHADRTRPFLELWQNSFYGFGHLPFTFAAGLDVILLFTYLACILYVQHLENAAHKTATAFVQTYQSKIDALIRCIADYNLQHPAQESNADKIAKAVADAVKTALQGATKTIVEDAKQVNAQVAKNVTELVEASKKTVTSANQRLDTLYTHQIMPLVTEFHGDMKTLHTELANYQGRLDDLTNASQQLAKASSDLTDASTELVNNASMYQRIGDDISNHLAELKTTQQEVVTNIESVARNIGTTADKMIDATSHMESAAMSVSTVANQIDQTMQNTITSMSTSVSHTNASLVEMSKELQTACASIKTTLTEASQPLSQVGTTLNSTITSMKGVIDQAGRPIEQAGTHLNTAINTMQQTVIDATQPLAQTSVDLQLTAKHLENVSKHLSIRKTSRPSLVKRVFTLRSFKKKSSKKQVKQS